MTDLEYTKLKLIDAEARNRKLIAMIDDMQKKLNGYRGPGWKAIPEDMAHGLTRYTYGCRCKVCKVANSDYQQAYRRRHGQSF